MAKTIPGATGDPFPAPAWTHSKWPDLTGYQLLYVGEDTLLAWFSPNGKYEMWKFTRSPAVGTSPLLTRIWQGTLPGITVGHDMIYLGGNRLLSWQLSQKRYRVWLINRNPPPGESPLGGGVPQTNGVWTDIDYRHTLISLGGDRVLVWEPNSGKFRIFRHDPAALGAADPIPGPPVAQGTWPNRDGSHDLTYLGGDRVLDRIRATGDYQVLVYDRTATGDPFAGEPHISKGQWTTIRTGHQLISLDGDRVLDWVESDGSYKLWVYDRNVTTLRKATVTVHIRQLVPLPDGMTLTMQKMVDHAWALFASYGIDVKFKIGRPQDEKPDLIAAHLDLDIGECDRDQGPSPDVDKIHTNLRNGVPKDEIVAFFVRSLTNNKNGCSTHPFERPGCVLEANRQLREDTLAHEIGHVLGLSHVANSRMLMYGSTREFMPGDFEGWEIDKMLKSPCAKPE